MKNISRVALSLAIVNVVAGEDRWTCADKAYTPFRCTGGEVFRENKNGVTRCRRGTVFIH